MAIIPWSRWEDDSRSAGYNFVLSKGSLPFSQKNKLPQDPILSQLNPVRKLTPYLFKVHFNIGFPSSPRHQVISSIAVILTRIL
jgi:hypothetical protein